MEGLSRFLVYILGRSPHEFGLVPEGDGFVRFKELLQVLHEEPGWRYVRLSHINEVLLGKERDLFEYTEKSIRARERKWAPVSTKAEEQPPKILYTPVRRRAHPVAMEKGISAPEGEFRVLTPDRDMAFRIGTRKDREPVLLEVLAQKAAAGGIQFYLFGALYLSLHIPSDFIAGPKVEKEVMEKRRAAEEKKEEGIIGTADFTPGSFVLEFKTDPSQGKKGKGKKRKGWKEEARKARKGKRT